MISNSEIISFLKSRQINSGFVDRLKIRYRPIVCPFDLLLEQVKDGDRVGDIGCGSGQFLLLVNKFRKPSQVHGIEITERLIKNAQELFEREEKKVPNHFSVYDGKTMGATFSECDVVFLIDVFHHVPKEQQQDFIRETYRALKPGARLILKDIDADSVFVWCNKLHDLVFAREIGNEYGFSAMESLVKKEGFTIITKFTKRTFVYPHYFLILQKPA